MVVVSGSPLEQLSVAEFDITLVFIPSFSHISVDWHKVFLVFKLAMVELVSFEEIKSNLGEIRDEKGITFKLFLHTHSHI